MKKKANAVGVGVGAIIVDDQGRLFLARRGPQAKNERGLWEFPGGSVEFGERVADALQREMVEEFGIQITVGALLDVVDHLLLDEAQHWVSPTYLCTITGGSPTIREPGKCTEIGWFSLDELPGDLTQITQENLAHYRRLLGLDLGGRPEHRLTHVDESGRVQMVDVGWKPDTERVAVAKGEVQMRPETLRLIAEGGVPKGDVLAVAQVAGIMAAKRTPDLIPLCHPLQLTQVDVEFEIDEPGSRIEITATVRSRGKTGVEMEALTAVSVAGLTIYDMAKAVEKTMRVESVRLVYKTGGKSGEWNREGKERTDER